MVFINGYRLSELLDDIINNSFKFREDYDKHNFLQCK